MAEVANNTNIPGSENSNINHNMKLRPRRSALSDISNTIAQQFTNMTRKVIKKRKLSVSIGNMTFVIYVLLNHICFLPYDCFITE